MKKSRHLAVMALGLSLGLVGLGPTALAKRHDDKDKDRKSEAAGQCATSQTNDSDNETGDAAQSGLINLNNIALQGNNLDVLGNLLCQGVFLNDIVAGVLGTAVGGPGSSSPDGDADCATHQDNESENETGDAGQGGLVNLNNLAVQGNNIDALGNALCDGNFLNDVVVSVLGTAVGGDARFDDDDRHGRDDDGRRDRDHDRRGPDSCTTDQDTDSENRTGSTVMGGLLNLNNLAVQGNNVAVLSNGLCGSVFLNNVLVSVLGIL